MTMRMLVRVSRMLSRGGIRRSRFRLVVGVHVRRFEVANAVSRSRSHQQGYREAQPVVGVKLHFGEQVSQRDTQENTGGKGESAPDNQMLLLRELLDAEKK